MLLFLFFPHFYSKKKEEVLGNDFIYLFIFKSRFQSFLKLKNKSTKYFLTSVY